MERKAGADWKSEVNEQVDSRVVGNGDKQGTHVTYMGPHHFTYHPTFDRLSPNLTRVSERPLSHDGCEYVRLGYVWFTPLVGN